MSLDIWHYLLDYTSTLEIKFDELISTQKIVLLIDFFLKIMPCLPKKIHILPDFEELVSQPKCMTL